MEKNIKTSLGDGEILCNMFIQSFKENHEGCDSKSVELTFECTNGEKVNIKNEQLKSFFAEVEKELLNRVRNKSKEGDKDDMGVREYVVNEMADVYMKIFEDERSCSV